MESSRTLIQAPPRGESSEQPTRRGPFAGVRAAREQGEELVLERYRLLERLGAGGFGVVWRARDELLHREVAVKRIWLGPSEGDRERATREAHASARLSHPAIVALYEAYVVGEAFYLISELVHGRTLARLIAEDALEDARVLEIGLALAGALEHAHARGVIHRDIKPHNVLVPDRVERSAEAAKLTDFGGASLAGEDALTRTGDVLGTLAYMAPEQSEGEEVGVEADLYALALVLYEALCGVNPVRGATPAATARRIGTPLESLARRRRDLPRTLTDALDYALSPEPEDRGTLSELRSALEDAAAAHGALDGAAGGALDGAGATDARVRPPGDAPTRRQGVPSRRRTAPAPARVEPGERRPPQPSADALGEEPEQASPARPSARLALPRALLVAAALLLAGWQGADGRPGIGLLLLAALAPVLVMPAQRGARRIGLGWGGCLLAPALGLAGLAGAFPALAGQARAWRSRALGGALGYWWLALAEPLLQRRLWLGPPAGLPARAAWEGSLQLTAVHVIGPLLGAGLLLGALLWALAAGVLPWIVRGRSATLDILAATVWSGALLALAPALDSGLSAAGAHPQPRGAVLGAILGAMAAVGARALRGPV